MVGRSKGPLYVCRYFMSFNVRRIIGIYYVNEFRFSRPTFTVQVFVRWFQVLFRYQILFCRFANCKRRRIESYFGCFSHARRFSHFRYFTFDEGVSGCSITRLLLDMINSACVDCVTFRTSPFIFIDMLCVL